MKANVSTMQRYLEPLGLVSRFASGFCGAADGMGATDGLRFAGPLNGVYDSFNGAWG